MRLIIVNDAKAVAQQGAALIIEQIQLKPNSVLGLATGSTPLALYQQLITAYQQHKISFQSVTSFNLDEYFGLTPDHPQSYRYFMNRNFFDHIDIDKNRTYIPQGNTTDPIAACHVYEKKIQDVGGIDLQLLGIGRNGHIGFNEPSSSLMSRTRIKTLTQTTIEDNARFFAADEYQPHMALTMGIGTILDAKKIILLATGKSKASAIKACVEGPLTAACPASALQLHQQAILILDEEAASELHDVEFYRHIERENLKLKERLEK